MGLSTIVVLAIALLGFTLSWIIAREAIGQPVPGQRNVFFYLYGRYEQPHLLLLAGSTLMAALYLLAPTRNVGGAVQEGWCPAARPAIVALCVIAFTWLGTHYAYHNFPLSMDEFNADFQSRIFAQGRLAAPVPPEFRDLIPAIKPLYVTYRPTDHTWLSGYLPVYAAIRAPFIRLGLGSLANPLLSGLSVLALAAVVRRLWPERRGRGILAVLILATSSQFLVTGMSQYSMPAHLLLNLCWLLLYLRGGVGLFVAPWVGALAMGLHNPFPHALFVSPFLARMLRMRQWRNLAYTLAVYAAGSAAWLAWWNYALPPATAFDGAGLFGIPGSIQWAIQAMNLSMSLTWQAPLLGIGFGVTLIHWRSLPPVERDILAGILLTVAFYVFVLNPQVHGWGYRYVHAVLGGLVLAAARGATIIEAVAGTVRFRRMLIASGALAIAIQLPLRLGQVEGFVRPWAAGASAIEALPARVVILPASGIWNGFDLIRNDPFFDPPIVVAASLVSRAGGEETAIQHLLDSGARVVAPEELAKLGLAIGAPTR